MPLCWLHEACIPRRSALPGAWRQDRAPTPGRNRRPSGALEGTVNRYIISGQHRDSGKLTAVARLGVEGAKVAAKQLAAAGYIRLHIEKV